MDYLMFTLQIAVYVAPLFAAAALIVGAGHVGRIASAFERIAAVSEKDI